MVEPSLQPQLRCKKAFADLQVVSDESARGTFGLLQKMLSSLGCKRMGSAKGSKEATPKSMVRSFLYTSDGGSDQQKFKKIAAALLSKNPNVFFISFSCLMHSAQLIVKTGFLVIDAWMKRHLGPDDSGEAASDAAAPKYFSTIAKISLTWRDRAKAIYKVWSRLFGDESAYLHCRKICPKCVAGRWGSIEAVEEFLLERQTAKTVQVLPEAFGLQIKTRLRSTSATSTSSPSDVLPLQNIMDVEVQGEAMKV